jgi:hypothetical protein
MHDARRPSSATPAEVLLNCMAAAARIEKAGIPTMVITRKGFSQVRMHLQACFAPDVSPHTNFRRCFCREDLIYPGIQIRLF